MSVMDEKIAELSEKLRGDLGEIELKVIGQYTLADAIREGSQVSSQSFNWGNGATACALTAAVMAAKARGYMA